MSIRVGGKNSIVSQHITCLRPLLFLIDQVLASFTQLVKLFIINGYAWDGSAAIVSMPTASLDGGAGAAGAEFCLTLVSPATIWSGLSLRAQRAELLNDYL